MSIEHVIGYCIWAWFHGLASGMFVVYVLIAHRRIK